MKKLGLTLLAAIFSFQLFSVPPALAKSLTPDQKSEIKALRKLIKTTKDDELRKQLRELIKEKKASFKA
jgi:hypothetical protein